MCDSKNMFGDKTTFGQNMLKKGKQEKKIFFCTFNKEGQ